MATVYVKNDTPVELTFYYYYSGTPTQVRARLTRVASGGTGKYTTPTSSTAYMNIGIDKTLTDSTPTVYVNKASSSYPETPTADNNDLTLLLDYSASITTSSGEIINYYTAENGYTYGTYFKPSSSQYITVSSNIETSNKFTISGSITNGSYTYTPDDLTGASAVTIAFSANDGYRFNTAPVATYDSETLTATISDDKLTATIEIPSELATTLAANSSTVTVTGSADAIPETYTITDGTIENCSYSYTDTALEKGTANTFTFTADTGYEFTSAPTINYYNASGFDTTKTATIADNKLTAIIAFSADDTNDIYNNITVNATATQAATIEYYTFTDTAVNHCSYSYTDTSLVKGTENVITFTANDGYYFADAPYITYDGNTITSVISEDTLTATLTITAAETATITDTVNVYATATAEIVTRTYTLENSSIENSSYTFTDESLTKGVANTFNFTANDGYYFYSKPFVMYQDSEGFPHYVYSTISDDELTATLTITADETDAINDSTNKLYVHSDAIVQSAISDKFGFITLFKPTVDILKQLASVRFYNQDLEVVDLGKYVQSLKIFYCDVNATNSQDVTLGTYDTNISCPVVDDDRTVVNCGSITVESTNENNNDFSDTVKIFLPFIGEEQLNADLVIGKTITLTYVISLITGGCVASITADDVLIYQFEGSISEDVPYILNSDLQMIGKLNFPNSVLYGFTPTITVIYNENYNNNGDIVTDDNKYSLLSDLSGYNQIDNLQIQSNDLTNDEIDLIISTLSTGVWF